MPEKRYTKVEEEILQILDKMEVVDERPARPPLKIVRSPASKARFDRVRRMLKAPWLGLVFAGVFAFLALIFKDSSQLATTIFASLAILAFLSPLVLRRSGSSRAAPQEYGTKLWRGRDISLEPPKPESPTDRARRWIHRQRSDHH